MRTSTISEYTLLSPSGVSADDDDDDVPRIDNLPSISNIQLSNNSKLSNNKHSSNNNSNKLKTQPLLLESLTLPMMLSHLL
jgi:hypothetical protein